MESISLDELSFEHLLPAGLMVVGLEIVAAGCRPSFTTVTSTVKRRRTIPLCKVWWRLPQPWNTLTAYLSPRHPAYRYSQL